MRSRAALAATLATLTLVATGCGGGSHAAAGSTPTAASSATDPAAGAAGVAPATGRLVSGDVLTYHLPAGVRWMYADDGRLAQSVDATLGWQVSYSEVPGGDATEAELASSLVADLRSSYGPGFRRLADRTVTGHRGVVLAGGKPGQYVYEWHASTGATRASFHFEAPSDSAKAHQMIDSVLASTTWR